MRNAESKVTEIFRGVLTRRGAYFVKLSDRFTRGLPDSLVVTNHVVMIEFKEGEADATCTWKRLGLSGLQDQRIRDIYQRDKHGACVVLGSVRTGRFVLYVPDMYSEFYNAIHSSDDMEQMWRWLCQE